ncbi:MAG: S8 family serine peptidase [Myxococcota bacterium]
MASLIFGEITNPSWYDEDAGRSGDAKYELDRVKFWNIHHGRDVSYMPDLSSVDAIENRLNRHFRIEARTPVGLSFSGTTDDFLQHFDIEPYPLAGHAVYSFQGTEGGIPLLGPSVAALEIMPYAISVSPSRRAVLQGMAAAAVVGCATQTGNSGTTGPTPPPGGGRFPLRDKPIQEVLKFLEVQGSARGQGVKVAVVDSGVSRGLPADPRLDRGPALAGLDPNTDERGHGTSVLHHLLTVAPEVDVRSIKYTDHSGVRNYPVAAFQRAVWPEWRGGATTPWPDIVLCSWVMADLSVALQREIAEATRNNVLVVFASGNGAMVDIDPAKVAKPPIEINVPATSSKTKWRDVVKEPLLRTQGLRADLHPIAHPDALLVGGVAVEGSDYVASSVATHFRSEVFAASKDLGNPSRQSPEVCGLVAPPAPEGELPGFFKTSTSPDSVMDQKPDGGARGDGQVLTSGTSMAAAQVAGVAAVLLQQHPGLRPASVRNVLMANGRDITRGRSGGPTDVRALSGWDRGTGFGRVDWRRTLDWLQDGAVPYLRSTLLDRGEVADRAKLADGASSPDVFVRRVAFRGDAVDLQARWGLAARHHERLSEDAPDGRTRMLYVRVSNRGVDDWEGRISAWRIVGDRPDAYEALPLHNLNQATVYAGGFVVVQGRAIEPNRRTQAIVVGLNTDQPGIASRADVLELVRGDIRWGVRWVGGAR